MPQHNQLTGSLARVRAARPGGGVERPGHAGRMKELRDRFRPPSNNELQIAMGTTAALFCLSGGIQKRGGTFVFLRLGLVG